MKSNFEQKLKSYTALAAGMMPATGVANAQIIYTDLDPDISISDSNYLLSLNNDTIPEFNIVHMGYFYYSTSFLNIVGIQALSQNEILGDTTKVVYGSYTSTNFFPKALNKNDLIDADQKVWLDSNYAQLYVKGVYGSTVVKYGNWQNVSDKFLGLRFKIGNDWHYGWARLTVAPNASSFTIKDYAYESHPNKKILAGQTFSNINENPDQYISIYPTQNQLMIFLRKDITNAQGSLYNLMGEKISQINLEKGKNIVETTELPSGIYILRVQIGDREFSKKFMR